MARTGRDGCSTTVPACFRGRPFALLLLAAAVAAGPAASQTTKPEVFEAVDPYTRGEAKALERAGYVTLAPVEWSEGLRTDQVKETLGGIDIVWVETAHFKIGSTLESYKGAGDPIEDDALEKELARLKKKLARYKDPKGKLDPWMRVHLYAQRLEDVYAQFEKQFGLSAADFPDGSGRDVGEGSTKLGAGPYLGQPRKFTVLLVNKTSSLARFGKRYAERDERPWDHYPLPGGSMFTGVSWEGLGQYGFTNEIAMHALVAAELTHNLIDGFRDSNSSSLLWLECGVAHVAARRVDERFVPSVMAAPSNAEPDAWKWEPRVRGLVENGVAKPWKDMVGWTRWDDVKLQGHLVAWSRAEWLLQREPAALRTYLIGATEPLEGAEGEARAKAALAREEKALADAFGKGLEELDAEWTKHVKKRYAKN